MLSRILSQISGSLVFQPITALFSMLLKSLNYDQECKPEIKVVLDKTLLPGKATQLSNTLVARAVNQYVSIIYS